MLVISLDEYGEFENKDWKKPYFIGGVVFKADNDAAIEGERVRISNWLNACCDACGKRFPKDLHSNRNGNDGTPDPLLAEVRKSMKAFFAGEDPWGECSGTYKIYATAGNRSVSPSIFSDGGNLKDDSFTSVRYQHMANSTVNHLLFDVDELATEDQIILHLAARRMEYPKDESERDVLISNGYVVDEEESGKVLNKPFVANPDSYRGMLLASLPTSDRVKTTYNLRVESISYSKSRAKDHAFLYLADQVCSFLSNTTFVERKTGLVSVVNVIDKACENLMGKDNFYLWAYHDIDHLWSKILKAYSDGDYFSCLSYMFDSKIYDDGIVDIYNKRWFYLIRQKIFDSSNTDAIVKALEGLERYYYRDKYENDRGKYVYDAISESILNNIEKPGFKALLSKMYSVEMIVNNHNGDYDAAKKSFAKAGKYWDYVSIEDMCEMRNKYAVALTDSGDYEDATNVSTTTIELLNKYIDWREQYTMVSNKPAILGKTYSQRGQCRAFMNANDMANQDFDEALQIFEEGSLDYQKTMSYYLHSLIEMGDSDAYESKAKEYFKTSDVTKQYSNISNLDNVHPEFALYVYIKALWVFYKDQIADTDIMTFLAWVKDKYRDVADNSHPKELIYKYCAFLNYYLGCEKSAEKYMKKVDSVSDNSDTAIRDIIENGKEEFERLKNGEEPFGDDYTYMYR